MATQVCVKLIEERDELKDIKNNNHPGKIAIKNGDKYTIKDPKDVNLEEFIENSMYVHLNPEQQQADGPPANVNDGADGPPANVNDGADGPPANVNDGADGPPANVNDGADGPPANVNDGANDSDMDGIDGGKRRKTAKRGGKSSKRGRKSAKRSRKTAKKGRKGKGSRRSKK
jgi:hypothetical protein